MMTIRYFDPIGDYYVERDQRERAGGDLGVIYINAVGPAPPVKHTTASRTYAAQTPRAASRPAFDYEEALAVDATLRAACTQTLRQAGRLLPGSVGGVQLRYFVRAYSGNLRYAFSSGNAVGGRIDPAASRIWISAVLSLPEAIRAVAHECRHYSQIGGGMSASDRERDAGIFAWAFWRRHGPSIESWARTWGRYAPGREAPRRAPPI